MAVQVLVNGVDLTAKYTLRSLRIKNSGMQGIATCDVEIVDKPAGSTVSLEHVLRVLDGGTEVFEGKIKRLGKGGTPDPGPTPYKTWRVLAQDYTHLLTQDVIDTTTVRTGSRTDKAEVEFLLTTFGSKGITVGSTVQNTGTISRDIDYTGMNLYEALEEAGKWMGTGFYVDGDQVAHWFVSEANAASFNLSDAPNNTTTFGYRDLDLGEDSIDVVNAVWVLGTGVSVWRTDAASIALYGRIENTLRDPDITTTAQANAAGDGYLLEHAFPEKPITLKIFKAGLKAGMTIQVTNALWGVSAVTYRVQEVTVSHNGSTPNLQYEVALDSKPVTLTDVIDRSARQTTATGVIAGGVEAAVKTLPADLSIAGANLAKNSSFESGSSGSWTVGSVWAFGFALVDAFHGLSSSRLTIAAANSGELVTTNFIPIARTDFYWVSFWSFLRSRSAGNFKMAIREYSSAGTLLATTTDTNAAAEAEWTRHKYRFGPNAQVPGTIVWNASTAKIKIAFFADGTATGTWDVDGVQVERGSAITAYAPSPQELVDFQITETQIADDAVTTPKLIANAVTAAKIAADTITANEIATDAITANEIQAGAVTASEIAAGAVNTAELNASAVIKLVTNAGADTKIDAAGLTIVGGHISVENGGGTVIIDGSSDMFRITATGTHSVFCANGSTAIDIISLSGLGAQSIAPSFLAYLGLDNLQTSQKTLGWLIDNSAGFAATTSGGAVTDGTRQIQSIAQAQTNRNNTSGFQEIKLNVANASGGGVTFWSRYYIMEQAAI